MHLPRVVLDRLVVNLLPEMPSSLNVRVEYIVSILYVEYGVSIMCVEYIIVYSLSSAKFLSALWATLFVIIYL